MKNYIIIILLLTICGHSFAHEKWSQEAAIGISKLMSSKREYERFKDAVAYNPTRYTYKRDSSYRDYLAQIHTIKKKADLYLHHINYVIKKPKGPKDFNVSYSHNPALSSPHDRNKYSNEIYSNEYGTIRCLICKEVQCLYSYFEACLCS